MKSFWARFLFVIACLFLASTDLAFAGPAEATVASIQQLTTSPSGWGAFSLLNVESYYAGQGVGGGQLIKTSCSQDNVVCFADFTGNTFKRVNPRWDAAEAGFVGDAATDNSGRMTNLIAAAVAANVFTITVSVNGNYYMSTGFSLPAFMTVQCASSGSATADDTSGNPNGDHKDYPYTFLIPASATISQGGANHGVSTAINGCNVENKAVYDTPNPTTLQSLYNIAGSGTNAGAFGGTGVTCTGDNCMFTNGMILGFTTGWTASGVNTPQLKNVTIDATNCVSLTNSQFIVGIYSDVKCSPILTNRVTNNLLHLPIQTIAASGTTPANYRYTLSTPCDPATGNCPLEGNLVWVGQPNDTGIPVGAESSAGRCTFHYIDNSNFECTNSQATATVVTGNTVLGSSRICGITTSIPKVRVNQAFTGTNIPASSVVTDVDSRGKCVWMNNKATATGSPANLTFTDNAYNPGAASCGSIECYNLRPYPSNRTGIGFDINNGANFPMFALKADDHQIGYRWINSPAYDRCDSCRGENQSATLDELAVGLDIEGGQAMYFSGILHYGTNQGTVVLNNNQAGSNVNVNIVDIQSAGSAGIGNIVLSNQSGAIDFRANNGPNASATVGSIFVGNGSRLPVLIHDNNSGGINFRTETPNADTKVMGIDNVFQTGSTVPIVSTVTFNGAANGTVDQAHATRFGEDYVQVTGVAVNGAGVMLKPAVLGISQTWTNAHASNYMLLYGNVDTGDTINAGTSSVGFPIYPGQTVRCYTSSAINWNCQPQTATSLGLQFFGAAPTPTGTGTPTLVSGSNDTWGEVTGGTSATSIVLTFSAAKPSAPFCMVSSQTAGTGYSYSTSTTALTIALSATTGAKFDYFCPQNIH